MLFGKLVNFLHLSLPLSLSSNALGIYNSLMPILVVYSIFSLTTEAASVTAILSQPHSARSPDPSEIEIFMSATPPANQFSVVGRNSRLIHN